MSHDPLQSRIEAYLAAQVGGQVRVSGLKRFPVGFSWATYALDVQAGQGTRLPAATLILRLGPDDALYSPYSSVRQFNLLSALARCTVPTPRVYWHSDDRSILGAPFFFCERVSGRAPLPSVGEPGDPVRAHREAMGAQFVGALADLHCFDWQGATELADWERGITPANTALRQVDVCEADYARWATRPQPAMLWALHWLRRNAPRAQRLGIVHGDYRIGNFLFEHGRISAVLDWESAHIGDPHEDLAWAALPQFGGGTGLVCRLMDTESFLAMYERLTGNGVDRAALRYYTVMSLLKLAQVYLASAHTFERAGASDVRMGAMATQAAQTLRQMQKEIEACA